MSPLDLGDATAETHTDESASGLEAGLLAPGPALSPKLHGVIRGGAKLFEPVQGRSQRKKSDPVGRRVGLRYVAQGLLTGAPLMLADLALMAAVIVVARSIVLWFGTAPGMDLSACFLPIATGFVIIGAELGLYPGIRLSPIDEFRRVSVAVTSIFAVWFVGIAILTTGPVVWNRCIYVATAYVLYLTALPACRSAVRRILANWSWWGFPTLVCGEEDAATDISLWLEDNRRLGLRPVGVITSTSPPGSERPCGYAGCRTDIEEVAERKGAYWAIVVSSHNDSGAVANLVNEHLSTFPHIHIVSELTGLPEQWAPRLQLEGLEGIHLQQNLMLPLPRATKRLIDLSIAGVGSLFLLPLLFYIAVAVKLSSRGPIIYGHERIGKDGRRFKAWKFRSMFENSQDVLEYFLEQHPELREEWEVDHKLRYDPRVTRIGRFIRKTSLDELPQLWNVIRGEMSLVGPRPIVTAEIAKYGHFYGLYTLVKPGITGLWQVSGRNNTTYDERVQFDAYYVRNWSPWMDLYLLTRTVKIVLFAKGAY